VPRLNPKATRYELFATLLLIGLALMFVVSRPIIRRFSSHPSGQTCEALLDRYVEHVVHAIEPKPLPGELSLRRTEARALAAEAKTFASCSSYLTLAEVDCAMGAPNADELERCLP